jgi:hypothetical protein
MKKKPSVMPMFVMIAVIGIVSTVLNSDFDIGTIFEALDINSLEALLDYINLGLGFLVLAGVFIFLIVRAARDEKAYFWEFNPDQDQEEDIT